MSIKSFFAGCEYGLQWRPLVDTKYTSIPTDALMERSGFQGDIKEAIHVGLKKQLYTELVD